MTEQPYAAVVEDDPPTRALVMRLLRLAGFVPMGFAAAEAAVLWLRNQVQPPALISIDHDLPAMTGAELCLALRRDTRFAAVPIVMLTSQRRKIDLLRSGVDALVEKPIDTGAYLREVRRISGR